MNIKKSYSLPYADEQADKIYSNYDYVYSKQVNGVEYWFINDKNTEIKVGTGEGKIARNSDFVFTTSVNNTNINDIVNALSQRIHNVGQDLSYWDVYHIRTSVENADELDAKFSALAPGESLVINTQTSFTNSSNVLSRGDVIVKTLDNQALLVKALTQGIYYPAQITSDEQTPSHYTITYKYSSSLPTGNEVGSITVGGETLTAPKPQIDLSGFSDTINLQPYNIRFAVEKPIGNTPFSYSFDAIKNSSTPLIPVIKFFFNNEEVYLDYTLNYNSSTSKYTITVAKDLIFNSLVCQIK